jgi:hypothetical protein
MIASTPYAAGMTRLEVERLGIPPYRLSAAYLELDQPHVCTWYGLALRLEGRRRGWAGHRCKWAGGVMPASSGRWRGSEDQAEERTVSSARKALSFQGVPARPVGRPLRRAPPGCVRVSGHSGVLPFLCPVAAVGARGFKPRTAIRNATAAYVRRAGYPTSSHRRIPDGSTTASTCVLDQPRLALRSSITAREGEARSVAPRQRLM